MRISCFCLNLLGIKRKLLIYNDITKTAARKYIFKNSKKQSYLVMSNAKTVPSHVAMSCQLHLPGLHNDKLIPALSSSFNIDC